jgi:hypothetical protein
MALDNSNSSSDLLYLFLDGRISATERMALFNALAADPELQSEMEDALVIRSVVARERAAATPPPELTAALFSKAGIALPTAAANVAAGATAGAATGALTNGIVSEIAQSTVSTGSSYLLPGILGGAAISLAAGIFSWFMLSNNSSKMQQMEITSRDQQSQIRNLSALLDQNMQEKNRIYTMLEQEKGQFRQTVQKLNQELTSALRAEQNMRYEQKEQLANSLQQNSIYSPENPVAMPPVSAHAPIAEAIQQSAHSPVIAAQHDQSTAAPQDNSIGKPAADLQQYRSMIPSKPMQTVQAPTIVPAEDPTGNVTVQLRSINGLKLFPGRNAVMPSDILFNNLSASIMYSYDRNQSIGAEFGQETFPIYDVATTGDLIPKSTIVWAGLSYRYQMESQSWLMDLKPWSSIVAGGSKYGPVGRIAAGVQWQPQPRFAFTAGIEASGLLFRYRNAWNNGSKISLTYGVLINF